MRATADELREAGTPTTSAVRIAQLRSHADPRIRTLCARHARLPDDAIPDLAGDPVTAVRAAIAWIPDLPPEVSARLFFDVERRVRRAAFACQELSVLDIMRLGDRRVWTPKLREAVQAALRDDAWTTREAFEHREFRWLASTGLFDRSTVGLYLADVTAAALIARNGRLTSWAALRIARSHLVVLQEEVGARIDLGRRADRLVAAFGRRWAAAAVARRRPGRLVAMVLATRRSRVVRIARTQVTSSKWLLYRGTFSGQFPIAFAAAQNSAAGPLARRRMRRSRWWAIPEALAHRTDLDPNEYIPVRPHAALLLALAANPATPVDGVRSLLVEEDPFVRQLARVHPSLPVNERVSVADDGDAPRWLLRSLARSQDVPDDVRERVLVWLALGGGTGDQNFDPVTCAGSPGALGVPRDQAFRDAAPQRLADGPRLLASSLWYTRALLGRGAGRLSHSEVASLAVDSHAAVRGVAAGYRSVVPLRALRDDVDRSVRLIANRTWATTPSRDRLGRVRREIRSPRGAALLTITVLALSGVAGLASGDSHEVPPSVPTVFFPPQSEQPHFELVAAPIDVIPTCAAGGHRVWVEHTRLTVTVTVAADEALTPLVFRLNEPGFQAPLPTTHLVESGSVGSWTITSFAAESVEIGIGAHPEKPLVVPFVDQGRVEVADRGGDC